ncbi:putative reverse transcriptase domain-containing protein [Tanacetum coccineum]
MPRWDHDPGSVGRPAAESRGGGTGGRAGREGGRVREPRRRNVSPTDKPEGQGNDQEVGTNGGVGENRGNHGSYQENIVNENIQGDVRNVIVNNDTRGCTYKKFLACNPKEYDGKGGAMINEMQKLETKLWNHAMVGAGHAAYTDRFHELARLVPHLVTPKNRKIERYVYGLAPQIRGMVAAIEPKTMQKVVQIAGALTDEAIRNGSITKSTEKRGNVGEPSKDKNGKDDNKRTRTGNAFATTTNPVRRENTGAVPKCTTYNFHHPPGALCHTCFNCNRPGHFAKDCRVVSRNVNPINARNPTARACYECGSFAHIKAVCLRLNQAKRPGETIRTKSWLLMRVRVVGTMVEEQKLGKIVVVRSFLEVFPDDLSGLPPVREIEFWIELIPEAIPVAKSPYRLAPSEMEELLGKLKEL